MLQRVSLPPEKGAWFLKDEEGGERRYLSCWRREQRKRKKQGKEEKGKRDQGNKKEEGESGLVRGISESEA